MVQILYDDTVNKINELLQLLIVYEIADDKFAKSLNDMRANLDQLKSVSDQDRNEITRLTRLLHRTSNALRDLEMSVE